MHIHIYYQHRASGREPRSSGGNTYPTHRFRLFTQKKRESWTRYVSQLNTNTAIKHVWNRVRKISGKNVCPPKQYLNGKDGAPNTEWHSRCIYIYIYIYIYTSYNTTHIRNAHTYIYYQHRASGREPRSSGGNTYPTHRFRLFTQKKRESWTRYVSQLNTNTAIKHVWNRVRKISGKNVCPPKQYLNGKDGAPITDPKDIANEHAAASTDNSSSAHYSARFQIIKAQDERARIDFTSKNTEVYNKPFRLRYLRCSILEAKPRAPGPDGIHNNLLKHLPEDTLKILKEILNIIWISGDLPHQWRVATVIPIPKPNKDHTNPLSYKPIALISCLCKVLERMINTRFIWHLEKYGILDKSQCGFRKHRSTTDHLVSLERYVRDAFAQKQQAVGLFFDLEKAYETTW